MFFYGGVFGFSKLCKRALYTPKQRHINIKAQRRDVFTVLILDTNGSAFYRTTISKLIAVVGDDAGKVW